MTTCASCGKENPDGFQFCGFCAAPLTARPAASVREERKVVSVLFCDLVGFTARAERMDPEDVRRLLQPYHARTRDELERFGGTVEKFIGDAVMAIFGAPIAREDDPERAVRAALAICDALSEDDELDVRIGITTGEAVISLGAGPGAGEVMPAGCAGFARAQDGSMAVRRVTPTPNTATATKYTQTGQTNPPSGGNTE